MRNIVDYWCSDCYTYHKWKEPTQSKRYWTLFSCFVTKFWFLIFYFFIILKLNTNSNGSYLIVIVSIVFLFFLLFILNIAIIFKFRWIFIIICFFRFFWSFHGIFWQWFFKVLIFLESRFVIQWFWEIGIIIFFVNLVACIIRRWIICSLTLPFSVFLICNWHFLIYYNY